MIKKLENRIYTINDIADISGIGSKTIGRRLKYLNIDTWKKQKKKTLLFRLTIEEFRILNLSTLDYRRYKEAEKEKNEAHLVLAKRFQDEVLCNAPEETKHRTKLWLQMLCFTGEVGEGKFRKGCMSK